jgi:hypothetical protein
MESVLAVLVGLGLAASCGFRVFVPLLVLSVAARAGVVHPGSSLEWIGSWGAITAFGVASVAEVVAYKVPWLDHFLDTLASPAAVVAGTIVAASQTGAIGADPFMQWSSAIIAGGGAAGFVQATSVSTRAASTVATGGLANPLISAMQSVLSVVVSVLSVVAPVVAVIFLGAVLLLIVRLVFWLRKQRQTRAARLA